MEKLENWYKELSKERKIFVYVISVLLIAAFGLGLIPFLILIYLELGLPKNNINKIIAFLVKYWKMILGIPLGIIIVIYIIFGFFLDPEITLLALIAPIILILIYLFAKKLDKKHQLEHPEDRGYKWGYSQGITIIVLNLSMLVFSLFFFYLNPEITSEFVSADIIGLALSLAVSIFFLFTAYGVCQRRRGSFIILTIFTFNPFIWVINYFYIKRRPYLAKK